LRTSTGTRYVESLRNKIAAPATTNAIAAASKLPQPTPCLLPHPDLVEIKSPMIGTFYPHAKSKSLLLCEVSGCDPKLGNSWYHEAMKFYSMR